jgi:hypothetical protein
MTGCAPARHDLLGLLLGVRRTGITASMAILEGRGLIRAT